MNQKRSIRNLIMHGGILAMAGIMVRIIGLVYRIPMLNIIGDEASGIYSASYNVYNIMLVLSSYGLPMAVSKLISDRIVKRQYADARKIFRISLLVASCTGGLAACITFFGADIIEKHFYTQYRGVAYPLRVLAPTIFIVSILGVLRGFYQGQGTTIPTALSQLFEQIVNAIVSIAGCYILMKSFAGSPNVAGYGAAGGTLGTAFGALTALILLGLLYMIYKPRFEKKIRKDNRSIDEPAGDVLKVIVATMLPIIIGQTFYQISAVIDDVMFGKLMNASGFTDVEIKRYMGTYGSTYVTLTGVVMGVASAMSASMLPSVVASKAKKEYGMINEKIRATVKTNMLIAIPSFMGMFVLGEPVIKLLFSSYDSALSGMMLKIGGIAVVFYTISTVTSSALQGIDQMQLPVRHSMVSLVIHVILVFGLLKFTNLGIFAIVIGTTTFPLVIMVLNLLALNRYLGYRQELYSTFIVPLLCSILMAIVTVLVYNGCIMVSNSNLLGLFLSIPAAGIVYFGLILLCRKRGFY